MAEDAATTHVIFYSTWDIVSETVTLLRYRCSYTRALAFLDHVKPLLRLVPYDDSVRSQAEDVLRRLGWRRQKGFYFSSPLSAAKVFPA